MPYAHNHGVKIYYEVEGDGPPLVMLPGLTACLEDSREGGYVEALKDDYQIVLYDARGHGKSDKPHDPMMYSIENIVGDVIVVLDSLGIESTNIFGYSYGGGIAFELAGYASERVRSLIIGGSGVRKPSPEIYEGLIKLFENGMEAVVSGFEQSGEVPPARKDRLLASDSQALTAICRAMIANTSDLMDKLPDIDMPVLLFAGEADFGFSGTKETSELLPDVTFITLPGLDHVQAAERSDLMIPHVREFLARVNKA